MTLSIAALFIFIFGAYSYGYLLVLSLREQAPASAAREDFGRSSRALFAACALWFVLHAITEFRALAGAPSEGTLVNLATLEIAFLFPGLIFHAYLREARSVERPFDRAGGWMAVMWLLYAAGVGLAGFFTAAIFGLVPAPQPLGSYLGISIGALFTVMSICALGVMDRTPRRSASRDQRKLRTAIRGLFFGVIAVFVAMNLVRQAPLAKVLELGARSIPLVFLLVSVYFEHRIQFYDLIIKRGVLLVISLLLTGAVFALSLGWIDRIPEGAARPWLLAVLLLPVAMVMPWLHDRVGRLLDRLWFGRDFTAVDAVKHVLSAMQRATDEPTLVAAAEATLSEMFHRRIVLLVDEAPLPDDGMVLVEVRTPSGVLVRASMVYEPGARGLLSEDVILLHSLAHVFGYMLENVRLQQKRQEQEQVAHELRLQTSRSELKALRAQINPHFLFNALNAIASLIHTDPSRADAAVEQLAEVFRYTLKRSEQEWAPLDQELAFARAYLDVEQARFGPRLTYAVHADPALSRAHVPSMLLQTLVENAVKHGISRLRHPGRIDIHARRGGRRVVLEVRDTGPGPDAPPAPRRAAGESFGLRSVRDRLEGHFGADAALTLARERDTTVARIEMPLVEDLALAAGAER